VGPRHLHSRPSKIYETADLKPGVGAAIGLEGPGAFPSCMWHMLCIVGLRGVGSRYVGVDDSFSDSDDPVGAAEGMSESANHR